MSSLTDSDPDLALSRPRDPGLGSAPSLSSSEPGSDRCGGSPADAAARRGSGGGSVDAAADPPPQAAGGGGGAGSEEGGGAGSELSDEAPAAHRCETPPPPSPRSLAARSPLPAELPAQPLHGAPKAPARPARGRGQPAAAPRAAPAGGGAGGSRQRAARPSPGAPAAARRLAARPARQGAGQRRGPAAGRQQPKRAPAPADRTPPAAGAADAPPAGSPSARGAAAREGRGRGSPQRLGAQERAHNSSSSPAQARRGYRRRRGTLFSVAELTAELTPADVEQARVEAQLDTAAAAARRAGAEGGEAAACGSDDADPGLAAAARAAAERCTDPEALVALRAAVLAQTAYRVPTGADFWERVELVRSGRSNTSVAELLRRHRREAAAWLHNVARCLVRAEECTGHQFRRVATSEPDLSAAEAVADQGAPAAASGEKAAEAPAGPPHVPPGWLLVADESSSGDAWLCVAGTQNPSDCFRDCMFTPVPLAAPGQCADPGAPEVHSGFLDGATKVYQDLVAPLEALAAAHPGGLRLSLTGHSLGGATAVLLACLLRLRPVPGVQLARVVTFGAPNVFCIPDWDGSLPLLLRDLQLFQFVNGRDPVPRALGAPLLRRLAKGMISAGVKALASVSAGDSERLLDYRFVGDLRLFGGGKAQAELLPAAGRERVLDALRLRPLDCRPGAAAEHRMGCYVTRVLAAADAATEHTHIWSVADAVDHDDAKGPGLLHPLSEAVFDKADGATLSKGFSEAIGDIFDRMQCPDGGGLDADALRTLFDWSDRPRPEYLLQQLLLDGDALDRRGWMELVEDACCSDLPWLARLLGAMGWEQRGSDLRRGAVQRSRADMPSPCPSHHGCPLLGDGDRLTAEAEAAADRIFGAYSSRPAAAPGQPQRGAPRGARPVIRTGALQALMHNIDVAEFLAAPSRRRCVAVAAAVAEEAAAAAGGAGSPCAGPASPPGGAAGGVTLPGWRAVFRRWCVDDEARMWAILHRMGFSEALRLEEPAAERALCWAPRGAAGPPEEAAGLPWVPPHLWDEQQGREFTTGPVFEAAFRRRLQDLWRARKGLPALPPLSVGSLRAANSQLELEIAKMQQLLAGSAEAAEHGAQGGGGGLAPQQKEELRRAVQTEHLKKQNEELRRRVRAMRGGDADGAAYAALLAERDKAREEEEQLKRDAAELQRVVRDGERRAVEWRTGISGEEDPLMRQRRMAECEAAALHTLVERARAARKQSEDAVGRQLSELAQLQARLGELGGIDVPELRRVKDDIAQADARCAELRRQLAVLGRAEASRAPRTRADAEELRVLLARQESELAVLRERLRLREEQLQQNLRAAAQQSKLRQGDGPPSCRAQGRLDPLPRPAPGGSLPTPNAPPVPPSPAIPESAPSQPGSPDTDPPGAAGPSPREPIALH